MFRILAVVVPGLLVVKASANGFRIVDQDAFATARGDAFVATADNASAVYYNPAGLTQIKGHSVRLGSYGILMDTRFTPPATAPNAGSTYQSDETCAVIPHFFYAYTPGDWPVSFGLGIYAPYGGNMSWPQTTGFRSVALRSALTNITFNPVVAVKILPSLSIAAGAMANYGKIEMEQGLRVAYLPPNANYFRFRGCGWSAGFNAGVLWQPLEQLSFGATYRSSTTFTMEGQTQFRYQPTIVAGERDAQADFSFPFTTVVGVSYRPTPKWNLEFNADYTDWSSMGRVTLHQSPAPPFPIQADVPITLRWRESWIYEAGVTRYFDCGWHVSAGYVFNESSVPDDYYTPLAADMDRHFFSTGAGYRGRRFNFDVAYQLGYGPAHTVSGSSPSSTPGLSSGQTADGTYKFFSHAVALTVGLNF